MGFFPPFKNQDILLESLNVLPPDSYVLGEITVIICILCAFFFLMLLCKLQTVINLVLCSVTNDSSYLDVR